jgi:Ca2+-transporting ATPase
MPIAEVVQKAGGDPERGLDDALAEGRLSTDGPNELAEAPAVPVWRRLLRQFRELVIVILIAAALIAVLMGDWVDAAAIAAIVVLNGTIGFLQEERAGRALAALDALSAPMAKVLRDGAIQALPARQIVRGDMIDLEAGDRVPADVRLVRSFGLALHEAALTGESVPAAKDAEAVLPAATPLGDRRNMAYLGTVVASGRARAVVVATGMDTELGRIAGMLRRQEPEPTPLQRRLAELGRILIVVALVIVALVFALHMLRGGRLGEVLLLSVSLAVAAVPEGLPAVVTIALALGLGRMARRNALIRRLPSVETLGCVTVICSDKTGTLTRNEMTVRVVVAGGAAYSVTGAGYVPRGRFLKGPESAVADPESAWTAAGRTGVRPGDEPDLIQALRIGARCNNATLRPDPDRPEVWQVIGDPTEGALLVAAAKAGIDAGSDRIVSEIPFDPQRKFMSVVIREPGGSTVMFTKGAPEVILARCSAQHRDGRVEPLTDARRDAILRLAAALATRALRVLALAYREDPPVVGAGYSEDDLVLGGLVGMIDPPREEAREAVRRCAAAGIRPVMITGDHPATALAVAQELEMTEGDGAALSGRDLDAMSDDELEARVRRIAVYARVSAEHKLRVVRAWKGRGAVVAMTGDGVNDAPAIRMADIGIAMGVTGTDVTREASDMVLTDDNFASIVNAVEEGRGIYDNIQKVLHYLLSCNAGEILFMLGAVLLHWPAPLVAIQILWINLVTDSLPALALAMEPPEPGIMGRPPRPPHEPIISVRGGVMMLVHGLLVAAVTALAFAVVHGGDDENLARARTVAFCTIAWSQLFFALACRSRHRTLWELGVLSNPHLMAAIAISSLLQLSVVLMPYARPVFESGASFAWEWALVFGLAPLPAAAVEAMKLLARALGGRGGERGQAVP